MSRPRSLTSALIIAALATSATNTFAQGPPDEFDRADPAANSSDLVARMLKFDKNSDGKITKTEVTDARLIRLWTRADADKDGSVTKSELEALATTEQPSARGQGGPGGPGNPGGPGGPGGPRGMAPKPGEVLPQMMRTQLKLTADQESQLDELQRDVDAKMAKILTDAQKTQLKQMSTRGPGGPGGPGGGRGGRGGPGGGGPGGGGSGNRPGGFDDGGSPPPPPPQ